MNFTSFKRLVFGVLLIMSFTAFGASNNNGVPLIWNIPETSGIIIPRGEFINQMQAQLFKTPRHQIGEFYVSGPTGIGKTYIAQTYAQNYRSNYDVVFFFNAKMSILEQLKKFNFEIHQLKNKGGAKDLQLNNNEPENIMYFAREFLRTSNLRWLIIFDNVDRNLKISNIIPDHTASKVAHIIFTSQVHNTDLKATPLPLPTQKASIAFFNNELSKRHDKSDSVLLLVKKLKKYPLALSQASSYLRKNSAISIEEYLNLLSIEKDNNPLKVSEKAIMASVNNIHKTSPQSKNLLDIISCMQSKNIPSSLLKHWFLQQENITLEDFTKAIDLAMHYSIITPTKNNSDFFETHDFIQQTIYNSLSPGKKAELNKSLVASIRAVFMQNSKDIINPVFSEIIDHAKTAFIRGMQEKNISADFLSLLIDILEHNNTYKRDFSSSYSYIIQIDPIFKSNRVKNPEIKARFFLTAARFFWRLGKLDECKNYLDHAEKYVLTDNVEDYNRLNIYLADLYIENSTIKMAEKHLNLIEKNVEKYGYAKKAGSSAHYYLSVLHRMTLADYFNLKGNFKAAFNNINIGIKTASDYYQAKTGVGSPLSVMAPIYNARNFSRIMMDPGSVTDNLLELADEMASALHGDSHRFVSVAKVLYAATITRQQPVAAINILQTSLHNLEQWFHSPNINKDQILAHLHLGKAYLKINETKKALIHLKIAFATAEGIFTDLRNTYVHQTLDTMVTCYLTQNLLYDAQNTYNIHKTIFSEKDPLSKSIFNKILTYYNQKIENSNEL